MYEKEATHIKTLLGDNCVEIHQMGSTAVPGLSAKPIIDILCVVQDLSECMKLKQYDYRFMGEFNIPCHYGFNRDTPLPKIHLHVVTPGNGFIGLNLCFRDALRNNEDLRLSYEALKQSLATDPDSQKFIGQWKNIHSVKMTLSKIL